MNHEFIFQGTTVEGTGKGVEDLAAVTDRRYIEVETALPTGRDRPTFDDFRATQARADLVAFTKTFFGLDGECPSPSGNLSA